MTANLSLNRKQHKTRWSLPA